MQKCPLALAHLTLVSLCFCMMRWEFGSPLDVSNTLHLICSSENPSRPLLLIHISGFFKCLDNIIDYAPYTTWNKEQ